MTATATTKVMLKKAEATRVLGEGVGSVMSNDNVKRVWLGSVCFGNQREKREGEVERRDGQGRVVKHRNVSTGTAVGDAARTSSSLVAQARLHAGVHRRRAAGLNADDDATQ
ncbi:g475 [Coccomyxa elongata]